MEASEERRKLLCQCGKPLGIFTAQGLELYCRFSKESTTVPYTISNLEEAVALVESRRRRRRSRGWTFSLYPRKTLGDGSWVRMARASCHSTGSSAGARPCGRSSPRSSASRPSTCRC